MEYYRSEPNDYYYDDNESNFESERDVDLNDDFAFEATYSSRPEAVLVELSESEKPEAVFVERIESVVDAKDEENTTDPIFFPYCHKNSRAVPSILLRSSLFTATENKDKPEYKETKLAVSGNDLKKGVEKKVMLYTGKRLDQYDFAVWRSIMHLACNKEIGQPFCVSESQILNLLGKSGGGNNFSRLKEQLKRLSESFLTIINPQIKADLGDYNFICSDSGTTFEEYKLRVQTLFAEPLITKFENDETSTKYLITISASMQSLFEKKCTYLNAVVLQALSRRPLALWLYQYFASQDDPSKYVYGMEKLCWLCGHRPKLLDNRIEEDRIILNTFKRQLKKNLIELEIVTAANGQRFCYDQGDFEDRSLVRITKC